MPLALAGGLLTTEPPGRPGTESRFCVYWEGGSGALLSCLVWNCKLGMLLASASWGRLCDPEDAQEISSLPPQIRPSYSAHLLLLVTWNLRTGCALETSSCSTSSFDGGN